MFVIVQSFNNVGKSGKDNQERFGLAMRNSGAAVTVTSLTDFIAFAVGASTVCTV